MYQQISFITVLTLLPEQTTLDNYLAELKLFIKNTKHEIKAVANGVKSPKNNKIHLFESIGELISFFK
jgi:hypothetical protein